MPAAPIFKIRDVVYLVESAALGELEAYRIGAMRQKADGDWLYQIYIDQKPPAEQTVGDRIDLKEPRELMFHESDLIDFCGALDIAITNVQSRVNRFSNLFDSECVTGSGTDTTGTGTEPTSEPPAQPAATPGAPKYAIEQQVFMRSSAQIGFLEAHKVTNIHQVPASAEFTYQLDLTTAKPVGRPIPGATLYFKERELVDKCEALRLVLAALDRKMARLLGLKLAHCASA